MSGCRRRNQSMQSQQTFGRRKRTAELLVFRTGDAQRARERLEDRLDLVVAGSAVEHLHVDVAAHALCEAFEEVLHQLGLEVADPGHLQMQIDDGMRPAAEIDGSDRQGFVHRHDEIPGAVDAPPRAERRRHRFTERDADVFDRVMLIDVEIAGNLQRQVEGAVTRHELQHVVEKPDAGGDVVAAAPFQRQLQANRGFARVAGDYRAAHRTSSIAAIPRRVSSTMPAVTRMQPSHPASFERSRTSTPRACRAATMAGARSPTRTSTKFAALGHVCSPSVAQACASKVRDCAAWSRYQPRYARSAIATGSAA